MKSIEETIRNIESLFPADSPYDDTSGIGHLLLGKAKQNMGYHDNWRDLPENVLREYERLCIEEDNRQTDAMIKKYKL